MARATVKLPPGIGPHLLGRTPSPPDPRDFQLADFMAGASPLDAALAKLAASRGVAKGTVEWATFVTAYLKGQAPPVPPPPGPPPPAPPPPTADKLWADTEAILDQGQTPHCVGFGAAQWGNTLPVDDKFTAADGTALYYECKVIDGEPGKENGSNARSAAKALQARGRIATYAFAASVDEIRAFVQSTGPVMIGSDWTNKMFTPTAKGYVTPTGPVAGGHFYVCVGDLPSEGALEFLNSWGPGWALGGRFKMKVADFVSLWASNGEACAAVELP